MNHILKMPDEYNIISLLTITILFCLSGCEWGRMWETPAVRPHEEKMLVMPEGTVPVDGGELVWISMASEDLHSPVNSHDPAVIGKGRSLYFTYCAQCHGREFDGNGTVGQSFAPLPTDLRTVAVQSSSEGALFKSISYGVPNGRQPPLATTIAPYDRWRIIAFVQSLEPQNN